MYVCMYIYVWSGSIAPPPRGCEHRPICLNKALDEIFRKPPFSVLAPSWVVEKSSLESQSRGCAKTPYLRFNVYTRAVHRRAEPPSGTYITATGVPYSRNGFLFIHGYDRAVMCSGIRKLVVLRKRYGHCNDSIILYCLWCFTVLQSLLLL